MITGASILNLSRLLACSLSAVTLSGCLGVYVEKPVIHPVAHVKKNDNPGALHDYRYAIELKGTETRWGNVHSPLSLTPSREPIFETLYVASLDGVVPGDQVFVLTQNDLFVPARHPRNNTGTLTFVGPDRVRVDLRLWGRPFELNGEYELLRSPSLPEGSN